MAVHFSRITQIGLVMEGTSVTDPRVRFGYFDTENTLNFMLELINPEEKFV